MIVATTDPITGNKVSDLDNAPFVIEGEGSHALKIYFESVDSMREYLATSLHMMDMPAPQPYAGDDGYTRIGTIH
jgi:hypothetical protein